MVSSAKSEQPEKKDDKEAKLDSEVVGSKDQKNAYGKAKTLPSWLPDDDISVVELLQPGPKEMTLVLSQ